MRNNMVHVRSMTHLYILHAIWSVIAYYARLCGIIAPATTLDLAYSLREEHHVLIYTVSINIDESQAAIKTVDIPHMFNEWLEINLQKYHGLQPYSPLYADDITDLCAPLYVTSITNTIADQYVLEFIFIDNMDAYNMRKRGGNR